MNELEMKGTLRAIKDLALADLNKRIDFMQATHAGDHITPTHTSPNGIVRPKSFFMKKATVQERQGNVEGVVGWGGKTGLKANYVNVPGYTPISKQDEARIIQLAVKEATFKVVSADDEHGGKFLLITGVPAPYAGFSYGVGKALPVEVHYTVVVLRANHKILSVYPADQNYIDGVGGGFVG